MTIAYLFILLPLAFYIPMFAYETYIAFRRIDRPLDKGGEYLHITWEVTHTLLILSLNYFMWLFNMAIVEVAKTVTLTLLVLGAIFIVRGVIYLQLFYIQATSRSRLLLDWLFALSHAAIAVCLAIIVWQIGMILASGKYTPTETYLPLLWPGVILIIPLISVPLYFLFKAKREKNRRG